MKSIFYALVFYLLFLFCSTPGVGLALLYSLAERLKLRTAAHRLNIISHYIIFALPLKLMPIWKVEQKSRSDLNRKIILVSNHLSLLDAPLVASHFIKYGYRIIFVGRSGQDKIPLVGWSLKLLGHIFIEFQPGNKAVGNSVRSAVVQLHNTLANSAHVAVVFFGTGLFQSPDEDPLTYELKNGPFSLSEAEKIPILPTWLTGTDQAMSPSDPLRAHPALLSVQTGEEISWLKSVEKMNHDCKVQLSRLRAQTNKNK